MTDKLSILLLISNAAVFVFHNTSAFADEQGRQKENELISLIRKGRETINLKDDQEEEKRFLKLMTLIPFLLANTNKTKITDQAKENRSLNSEKLMPSARANTNQTKRFDQAEENRYLNSEYLMPSTPADTNQTKRCCATCDFVLWIRRVGGQTPSDAVMVDQDFGGGPVYVARANIKGQLAPGKYVSREQKFSVGYFSKEYTVSDYEILVANRPLVWKKNYDRGWEKNAIYGGYNAQRKSFYVCRAKLKADGKILWVPGKLLAYLKMCYIPLNEKEHMARDYEVLYIT